MARGPWSARALDHVAGVQLLRRLAETPREARSLAMFGGAVICAPVGMALMAAYGTAPVFAPQAVAWLGLLLFAALVLVGNLALQYGAARLSANVLSVLMLSEILVATLSSWIAGAATLSPITLGGGALILGASLLAIWSPPARASGRHSTLIRRGSSHSGLLHHLDHATTHQLQFAFGKPMFVEQRVHLGEPA